ncbi:hypothetical protein [Massilia sp. Mn16-1_5]|uniref:hypothetical protein n=1 Tax=Massilia sp. Mn16-1_5 TaxID=2079199 RepID=UPI00109E91F2|nr:hypothetical protein [Massilia sp. Mn16-1_5]THC45309.1 hypothetical protein C2862_05900 [Massilia sp. Mn16-1_5]
MFRRLSPALALATVLGAGMASLLPAAQAADQAADKANVRGKVVTLAGNALVVASRDGKKLNITLAEGWKVAGVSRASMADIKPGAFVGIASLPKAAGGDGALEVLVFPPAMKGLGEGSYAWDLKPNSNMTNATVANAVKDVDGHSVTVSYHGKEKKIAIPDGTPIVTLGPATPGDLKPGAVVFVPAMKDARGGLVAQQVVVGTNGVVPPM